VVDDIDGLSPEQVLDGFLGQVKELLASIVGDANLIPADLRLEFEEALQDLEDHFQRARQALGRPGIREELVAIGLAGKQLRLKIAGWRRALGRFWQTRTARVGRIAIRWADVILGSLHTVIPVVEVIGEFVEAVDAAINDEGPA
jgi:hypothetical protein